jgi:3-hydroxyisobutyrate dehydrogenase
MRVGFTGLGNMGGPIALNLIRAGHLVVVNDLDRKRAEPHLAAGAKWASSPREAAQESEVMFTSLPGPKEIELVALGHGGLLEVMRPGSVYVDLSTNSPLLVKRLHAEFLERGIDLLDAPVSGGVTGAAAGTLALMVGGAAEAFERVLPLFEAMGNKITRVGNIGAGTVAKLVHNVVVMGSMNVLAEALTLGVRAGVSADVLVKVLEDGGYGQGSLLKFILPKRVLRGAFDEVAFAVSLARKDVAMATELARALEVPMQMINLVEQDLIELMAKGSGAMDVTTLFAMQETRAQVVIRSDPAHAAR